MRFRAALVVLLALACLPAPVLTSVPKAAAAEASEETDFLFRLGMMEGHLLIAHELIAAHQAGAAMPHFGHPVRELYQDIADYLAAKRFPAFDRQLAELEASAAATPYSAATEAKYQAVMATLHKARELAPAALRASLPEMIRICADTVDAASGEYGEALEQGRIASPVEYHDSRGFLAAVGQQLDALRAEHPDAAAQNLLARFASVVAKAQWIVGDLLPAPTPRASLADYRVIAAEAARLAHSSNPVE